MREDVLLLSSLHLIHAIICPGFFLSHLFLFFRFFVLHLLNTYPVPFYSYDLYHFPFSTHMYLSIYLSISLFLSHHLHITHTHTHTHLQQFIAIKHKSKMKLIIQYLHVSLCQAARTLP